MNRSMLVTVVVGLALSAAELLALQPPSNVPDSGGTVGILALAAIILFACRRQFKK